MENFKVEGSRATEGLGFIVLNKSKCLLKRLSSHF